LWDSLERDRLGFAVTVGVNEDSTGRADVKQGSQAVGVFAVTDVDVEDKLCAAAATGTSDGE
jgi:hypothetical protein